MYNVANQESELGSISLAQTCFLRGNCYFFFSITYAPTLSVTFFLKLVAGQSALPGEQSAFRVLCGGSGKVRRSAGINPACFPRVVQLLSLTFFCYLYKIKIKQTQIQTYLTLKITLLQRQNRYYHSPLIHKKTKGWIRNCKCIPLT